MSARVRFIDVTNDQAGQRLDNFLIRVCKGVPKSHVYKSIRSGEVRVNKGRSNAMYRLQEGDSVRIPPMRLPDSNSATPVPPATFPVVYEDDVMLVIDKPAGVAVHGGSGVSFGVIEQLRASGAETRFLELVHRLDRETSGVLMLAKKRSALISLQQVLRESRGHRYYDALVIGDWVNDRQHLKQPLLRWLTKQGERRVRVDKSGKAAHTIITLKKRLGAVSWVRAELKTGRTHQIRVHLAHAGHPILCDDKYGSDSVLDEYHSKGYKRMFLHASELNVPHPTTGKNMVFKAPLPSRFNKLIQELEQDK